MTDYNFNDNPLVHLLRMGQVQEFNRQRAGDAEVNLVGADLRHVDLRELDPKGLDLSNAYLREADLRGLDLSMTRLHGASIHSAKISGALFPPELEAAEIDLSLAHGTRMRYR